METNREDFGIAIRSAFLQKGTKQRFSLFVLVIISIIFLFLETLDNKPLNYVRSIFKDLIFRGSMVISSPAKGFNFTFFTVKEHFNLYSNYDELKKEYENLKNKEFQSKFLELENVQLRQLIDDQIQSPANLISSRVMIDKKSPYLNSFIINSGSNKNIKNGMAVLDGQNFIGRIVDVNFFSSRVLLISDLNSKIPVVVEPSGNHAILSGNGLDNPTLDFLPENHSVQDGDKVYTSGKEGLFLPGIPIGVVKKNDEKNNVNLFSKLDQITFVNINIEKLEE